MKNVIIGQSGGPTAAINATLAGAISKARFLGAEKVYGMIGGVQGFSAGNYVDLDE